MLEFALNFFKLLIFFRLVFLLNLVVYSVGNECKNNENKEVNEGEPGFR